MLQNTLLGKGFSISEMMNFYKELEEMFPKQFFDFCKKIFAQMHPTITDFAADTAMDYFLQSDFIRTDPMFQLFNLQFYCNNEGVFVSTYKDSKKEKYMYIVKSEMTVLKSGYSHESQGIAYKEAYFKAFQIIENPASEKTKSLDDFISVEEIIDIEERLDYIDGLVLAQANVFHGGHLIELDESQLKKEKRLETSNFDILLRLKSSGKIKADKQKRNPVDYLINTVSR